MNDIFLDYEKLDVYQLSLEFVAWVYVLCKRLKGPERNARKHLHEASMSITLNIAEGCGRMPSADRRRFWQIAGGSARECGAVLDVLVRCGVMGPEEIVAGKKMLVRIVPMLTKMIE